jgi:hypothetical protein
MRHRISLLVVAAVLVVGFAAGCSDSDDESGTSTSTTAETDTTSSTTPGPTSASTSTTAGSSATTTAPSPTTTAPIGPTSTAQPGLTPGAPCAQGSSPDCIDPYGDGQFVYLLGGADCMASPIGGPSCADLDEDGYAGYPDQG